MIIPDSTIKTRDIGLNDILNNIQIVLNNGLYEMRVFDSVPDWLANDGESGIISSGSTLDLYIHSNGTWYTTRFGTESLTIVSGTYTPTLTSIANLAAPTAFSCQYSRVGNTVAVSGKVNIDPLVTLTATSLNISLPIASTFTSDNQCGGTACSPGISGQVMAVVANTASAVAQMQWNANDVTSQNTWFSFYYRVI